MLLPIEPPIVQPFDDGINWVLQKALNYHILNTNLVIYVPEGFVTDFASVPKILQSFLSPFGPHGSPAIVHDFLYWDQSCTKQQGDQLFLLAMKEQGASAISRSLLYYGVRLGGGHAWHSNATDRNKGLPRVIPSAWLSKIPPRISWDKFRMDLYATGVKAQPKDPTASIPDYCDCEKVI